MILLVKQVALICRFGSRHRIAMSYPTWWFGVKMPSLRKSTDVFSETPIVVAEVLSPSSVPYDRGLKLEAYRQIASVSDYLIISPERVSVEHYSRVGDGTWAYRHYVLRDQVIKLERLKIEVSVRDLYKRLKVPEGVGLVLGLPVELPNEKSSE